MKRNVKNRALAALFSLLVLMALQVTAFAANGMQIIVSTGTGIRLTIDAESDTPVENVKAEIERQAGIPAQLQQLVFENKVLEDGTLIQDYSVEKDSELQLLVQAQGTGTAEDPYRISRPEELVWFAGQVNGGESGSCAVLTADISLGGMTWTPMGSEAAPYTGSFDGNGFTVSDFSVSGGKAQGFFGACENAQLSNITIKSAVVEGNGSVGGIVGYARGGSITGCVNGADLRSTNVGCGGIVGVCEGVTITNCVNNGSILKGSYQNGGIAGRAIDSLIDRCINNGSISNADHSGGIAAYNVRGTVSNCLNTGSISTTGGFYCYTAGIVANNTEPGSVVKNCLNLGSVSGVGGKGCRVNAIVCANDSGGGWAENCYSLETTGDPGLVSSGGSVTAEELASGSVAWKLNGQAAGDWKQTIGTDAVPGFTGDAVYPLGDGSYGPVCDHVLSTVQPTCTDDAVCTLCGAVLPAAGHRYGEPVWSWAEDGKTASVTFTCTVDDHSETPVTEVIAQVVTPATCTEPGVTRYTAKTVFGGAEYTHSRELTDLPAAGHSFANGVCAVCGEADPNYREYVQDDGSWTMGDGSGASVNVPPELGKVDGVFVGDRELTGEDYTLEDGRLVIRPEVLEALKEGEHSILIRGENGVVKTTLTVKPEPEQEENTADRTDGGTSEAPVQAQTDAARQTGSPQTGDPNPGLWFAVLAAAAAALAAVNGLVARSRRNQMR